MFLYLLAREPHECLWDCENNAPASLTAPLQLKLALEEQPDFKKSGYLLFINHMRNKISKLICRLSLFSLHHLIPSVVTDLPAESGSFSKTYSNKPLCCFRENVAS